MKAHQRAKTFLRKQVEKYPKSKELKFEQAYTLDLLGALIIRSGISEMTFQQDDQTKNLPFGQKMQRNVLFKFVQRELEMAARIFDELHKDEPWKDNYLSGLATTQRHQLVFALMADDADSADKYFKSAVESLEYLTTSYKDNPNYIYELADTLSMASTQLPSIDSLFRARQQVKRALGLCQTLTEKFPKVGAYQLLTANCHRKLAMIEAFDGNEKQASTEMESTLTLMKQLMKDNPDNASYQVNVTLARKQFADTVLQVGLKEDSAQKIRHAKSMIYVAIREFEQFARLNDSVYYDRVVAGLYGTLAKCHLELGDLDQAALAERRAQHAINQPLIRRSPIFERRFRKGFGRK